jgi:hypothetical protein
MSGFAASFKNACSKRLAIFSTALGLSLAIYNQISLISCSA